MKPLLLFPLIFTFITGCIASPDVSSPILNATNAEAQEQPVVVPVTNPQDGSIAESSTVATVIQPNVPTKVTPDSQAQAQKQPEENVVVPDTNPQDGSIVEPSTVPTVIQPNVPTKVTPDSEAQAQEQPATTSKAPTAPTTKETTTTATTVEDKIKPPNNTHVDNERDATPEMLSVKSSGQSKVAFPHAFGEYKLMEDTSNSHNIWKKKSSQTKKGKHIHGHRIKYDTHNTWTLVSDDNKVEFYNAAKNEKLPTITTGDWKYSNGKNGWHTDKSFKIIRTPVIEGTWCEWAEWGMCDVDCGGGTKKRNRECMCTPPGPNGQECGVDDYNQDNTNVIAKSPEMTKDCNCQRCTDLEEAGVLKGDDNDTRTEGSDSSLKKNNTIIIVIFCLVISNLVKYYAEYVILD